MQLPEFYKLYILANGVHDTLKRHILSMEDRPFEFVHFSLVERPKL